MSTENLDCTYSLPAAADLSANQGAPITINTSGQVALAGANAEALGHLHNKPKAGEDARFIHNGKVLKAKLTGTVGTPGLRLATSATGYAVATTGQKTAAISLQAGVSGDVVSMLFINGLAAAP